MNSEVAWVLVSSETQVQPQIMLDPDYLPNYLSISYDYAEINVKLKRNISTISLVKTPCIFLIFLIATVQVSTECKTQGS